MKRLNRAFIAAALLSACLALPASATPAYDPMAVEAVISPRFEDLDARDAERDRTVPLRIYLPAGSAPAPVILFSHGLGGSRDGSSYLGQHWSARGYVVVFLQHPGSDESIWQDLPRRQIMRAMQQAANAQNSRLRMEDVAFTLDQLAVWNAAPGHVLSARMDLEQVGMSGHSFGAVTTQAVSGQSLPRVGARFTDPRIDAAIAMSPSSGHNGLSPQDQFGSVALPWFLMTGTEDTSAIGGETVETRRAVYAALPAGEKYELVLDGGAHHAFTDGPVRRSQSERDPDHHPAILALSTAFWDAYLRDDEAARAWLDGEGAQDALAPEDIWQRK